MEKTLCNGEKLVWAYHIQQDYEFDVRRCGKRLCVAWHDGAYHLVQHDYEFVLTFFDINKNYGLGTACLLFDTMFRCARYLCFMETALVLLRRMSLYSRRISHLKYARAT